MTRGRQKAEARRRNRIEGPLQSIFDAERKMLRERINALEDRNRCAVAWVQFRRDERLDDWVVETRFSRLELTQFRGDALEMIREKVGQRCVEFFSEHCGATRPVDPYGWKPATLRAINRAVGEKPS